MKQLVTKRNLTILGIALLVILTLGYVATGPYRTISAIQTAIEEQDQIALDDNIDFFRLKQSLRDQMTASMAKSAAEEKDGMNALATGFATLFMDKMLDSLVTPAGIARLSSGKSIGDDESAEIQTSEMFKNARYKYDSLSTFSIYVPNESGEEARFVLKRDGLHWKLCYIIAPMDDPSGGTETETADSKPDANG